LRDFLDEYIPWRHEWRGKECWGPIDLSKCIAAAIEAWCRRTGIKRVVCKDGEFFYYKRKALFVSCKEGKNWDRVWRRFSRWAEGLDYASGVDHTEDGSGRSTSPS